MAAGNSVSFGNSVGDVSTFMVLVSVRGRCFQISGDVCCCMPDDYYVIEEAADWNESASMSRPCPL